MRETMKKWILTEFIDKGTNTPEILTSRPRRSDSFNLERLAKRKSMTCNPRGRPCKPNYSLDFNSSQLVWSASSTFLTSSELSLTARASP